MIILTVLSKTWAEVIIRSIQVNCKSSVDRWDWNYRTDPTSLQHPFCLETYHYFGTTADERSNAVTARPPILERLAESCTYNWLITNEGLERVISTITLLNTYNIYKRNAESSGTLLNELPPVLTTINESLWKAGLILTYHKHHWTVANNYSHLANALLTKPTKHRNNGKYDYFSSNRPTDIWLT